MKVKSESEVAQSCPTLSNPMDCSLPGSSVHGIFQARVLEWGAIAITPQILIFNSMYEKYHCINFFWLHHMACGILVPNQELNPSHDSESAKP